MNTTKKHWLVVDVHGRVWERCSSQAQAWTARENIIDTYEVVDMISPQFDIVESEEREYYVSVTKDGIRTRLYTIWAESDRAAWDLLQDHKRMVKSVSPLMIAGTWYSDGKLYHAPGWGNEIRFDA